VTAAVLDPSLPVVRRLLDRLLPVGFWPDAAAPGTTGWDGIPFATAVATTEHVTGVLPLLDLFPNDRHPTVTAVRDGALPAALALFTPNAALAMPVPAIQARRSNGDVLLDGRCRYHHQATAVSLVAVGVDGGLRLCLVRHDGDGVRVGAIEDPTEAGWIELTAAPIDTDLVSGPVSWEDEALTRVVDGYASAYVTLASRHATAVIAGLRRALAGAEAADTVLSSSQLLAHELTRLDIELSLLSTAADRLESSRDGSTPGDVPVVAALAAATDLAYRTAQVASDFATQFGLPTTAPWSTATLQGHFGGRRMVEGELARRMGLLAGRA